MTLPPSPPALVELIADWRLRAGLNISADAQRAFRHCAEKLEEAALLLGGAPQPPQDVMALIGYLAGLRMCEEDADDCVSDSGPTCQRHGENDLHADQIRAARELLATYRTPSGAVTPQRVPAPEK